MQKMHHSILITSCLMQAFVQIIFFTCQKRPALRPRFPNFDARFTVASCGSNSPVGSIFFAASNYNYRQLNLLFEAFNVHGLILHKLDHRRKNWCFAFDLNKLRTPPKPKSIDKNPTQSTQKPLWRANEAFDGGLCLAMWQSSFVGQILNLDWKYMKLRQCAYYYYNLQCLV